MTTLICNRNASGGYMVLTDEHASSSYGHPVLISNGTAHGPLDLIDNGLFGCVAAKTEVLATRGLLTDHELDLLRRWRAACGSTP